MRQTEIRLRPVSVVIPTWNRKKDLLECLESVSKIDYPKELLRVIVVDNNSTDGTADAVRKLYPAVTLIELNDNRGLGGGINVGIKRTRDKYIYILDSDVVVDHKALKELVKVMEANPRIGFAAGKLYEYDQKNKIQTLYGIIDPQTFHANRPYAGEEDRGQVKEITFVDYLSIGSGVVRRSAMKKIGFMDEKYFVYFDDTDLFVSLKKAGYFVAFVPKAAAWHKKQVTEDKNKRLIYYLQRNSLIIRKKFNGMNLFDHYKNIRFLLSSYIFSFFNRSKRKEYRLVAKAILDFYRNKLGPADFQNNLRS